MSGGGRAAMQGGIRRKRELLPRYRNGGRTRSGVLTTPMKKILAYVCLLSVVFVLLRFGLSGAGREVSYELDGAGNARSVVVEGNGEQRETVPFNNEVARQQEVKNLENDNRPPAPERRRPAAKGVGEAGVVHGDKRVGEAAGV